MRRRRSRGSDRLTLRQLEAPGERQEGMRDISTIIDERLLCVRDLARMMVAIGKLDVDQALAQIAEWKRLEAMYVVDAELAERPLVRYVRERTMM